MVSRMERTAFAAWWWTVDKLLLAIRPAEPVRLATEKLLPFR